MSALFWVMCLVCTAPFWCPIVKRTGEIVLGVLLIAGGFALLCIVRVFEIFGVKI